MDALAVHEWVMEKAELPIATEDAEEGIASETESHQDYLNRGARNPQRSERIH